MYLPGYEKGVFVHVEGQTDPINTSAHNIKYAEALAKQKCEALGVPVTVSITFLRIYKPEKK